MDGMMKTAVMTAPREIRILERPVPRIQSDEVLVRLEHVGICGSDLHYFEHGRIGDFVVEYPFVLGHEAAGTVVETGRDVLGLKVGERVALEPGIPCGVCDFCLSGKYNLCDEVRFFATPPIDGVFQEYVAHKAAYSFKLPDSVSTLEGALIEPLAVGFHAANQSDPKPGQSAIVYGAGCIGLMTMMALRAKGIEDICVVDVVPVRLQKAMQLHATWVVDASKSEASPVYQSSSTWKGFDIAVDTSGAQSAIDNAVQVLKKGATLVFVGYSRAGRMDLPLSAALNKELQFKTVFRYRNIYPMAIEAVASGEIHPADIVTDFFDFTDIQTAMEKSILEKTRIVKSVIRF
jgi:L-iditol 2-dehydrogenase